MIESSRGFLNGLLFYSAGEKKYPAKNMTAHEFDLFCTFSSREVSVYDTVLEAILSYIIDAAFWILNSIKHSLLQWLFLLPHILKNIHVTADIEICSHKTVVCG